MESVFGRLPGSQQKMGSKLNDFTQKMNRLESVVDISSLPPGLEVNDDNIMDIAYALINGEIPGANLFPNARAHEERIKQEKDLLTSSVEEGINVCRKCGSRKVTEKIVQMRSGDEAYNAIFHCEMCGATRIG